MHAKTGPGKEAESFCRRKPLFFFKAFVISQPQHRYQHQHVPATYTMEGLALPNIDIIKHLGVCFSADLNFRQHYLDISRKFKQRVSLLCHMALRLKRLIHTSFCVREIVVLRSTFSRRDAFPVREMKYESAFTPQAMMLLYRLCLDL